MDNLAIYIGLFFVYGVGLYVISISDLEWMLEETNMMFTALYPAFVGAFYLLLLPSKYSSKKDRNEVVRRG